MKTAQSEIGSNPGLAATVLATTLTQIVDNPLTGHNRFTQRLELLERLEETAQSLHMGADEIKDLKLEVVKVWAETE